MEDHSVTFSTAGFRKRLTDGLFSAIRCRACKRFVIPPSSICSNCLSKDLEWDEISRTGKVVTFSEIHVSNKTFEAQAPYIVMIIETEEGIRLPGIIRGVALKDLKVGSRIEVNLEKTKTGTGNYYFSLAA